MARLMFIGLWNFADDAGRHPLSAKQVKAEIFPADDLTGENILGMLDELSRNDLIVRYAVDGKEYLQITGWHHQRIDKPQKAKHPGPEDERSANVPGTIDEHSRLIGGIGGIGEEGSKSADAPPALNGHSRRFTPPTPDEVREYVSGRGSHVNPQKFVDHYTANGWRVGKNPMKDWQAAVRTWEQRDKDDAPPPEQRAWR